jgi:pimeloyl-ACP methyl ester carboxylesterase
LLFLSSRSHGSETAKSQAQFAKVLEEQGSRFDPFRMGILMSAHVGDTDAQAQDEAKEGVWYFLKNCLKGHLRREGRMLTAGPGIPYIPPSEFRNYLKFSDPSAPLLGDAEDWSDLQRAQSIIVGGPDTVYRRIIEIVEHAKCGHLLIQFHMGNMPDALVRNSMTLFARRSRRGCGSIRRDCSGVTSPKWNAVRRWHSERYDGGGSAGARWRSLKRAKASRWSTSTALPTCTASPPIFKPFHLRLGEAARVIAPAHPGCAQSDELAEGYGIEDVIFHYLEVFDALGLESFDLVGHCVGGWIAAELAVRYPERVRRLGLIGACGLFVPGAPIGDVFMHSQPERGVQLTSLRSSCSLTDNAPAGLRFFASARGDLEEEMRRYQMLRFGSFIGFKPPYFYNRVLRGRLYRAAMPAAVIWGAAIAWCRAPTATPMSRACRRRGLT